MNAIALTSPWLTPAEAAAYMKRSRSRVYKLVHFGLLPTCDGRIHRDDVDAFMRSRQKKAKAPSLTKFQEVKARLSGSLTTEHTVVSFPEKRRRDGNR